MSVRDIAVMVPFAIYTVYYSDFPWFHNLNIYLFVNILGGVGGGWEPVKTRNHQACTISCSIVRYRTDSQLLYMYFPFTIYLLSRQF